MRWRRMVVGAALSLGVALLSLTPGRAQGPQQNKEVEELKKKLTDAQARLAEAEKRIERLTSALENNMALLKLVKEEVKRVDRLIVVVEQLKKDRATMMKI